MTYLEHAGSIAVTEEGTGEEGGLPAEDSGGTLSLRWPCWGRWEDGGRRSLDQGNSGRYRVGGLSPLLRPRCRRATEPPALEGGHGVGIKGDGDSTAQSPGLS